MEGKSVFLNKKMIVSLTDELNCERVITLLRGVARTLAKIQDEHCVKSVRIRSFSGPYSVRMRESTDQSNSNTDTFYAVEELDVC